MINSDNGNIEEYLKLQNLLANIADDFLQTDSEKFDIKINQALKELGKFVDADRVYIFDYDFDKHTCSNTYEWCSEGIFPVINDLQDVPLDDISYWVDAHTKGEAVYIPSVMSLNLNDGVRKILEPQGVLSLLAVPMLKGNKCYGFIGFDSVRNVRTYSEFERVLLSNFTVILLSFIQNREINHELEKTRHLLDSILNEQKEYIIRFDIDGRVTYANKTMARLLGMSTDSILKLEITDIAAKLYPNNLDKIRNFFKDLTKVNSYIGYINTPDNKGLWIEWSQYPIFSKGKSIIKYQIVGRDITQRKIAEIALEREKNRLEYIIEASRLGVWEVNLISGEIRINDIYASMMGYSTNELTGLNFYIDEDRVHPDDKKVREENFYKVLNGEQEYYNIECRYRHKDGSWVWVSDQGKVMSRSEDGNPLFMYGTHLDITEKKINEEKLRNISHAIEYSPTGIVITNKEGEIEYANPKILEMTGYDSEELKYKNPRIFSSGYHDNKFYESMWREILSGNTWNGRIRNKRKNGELYWEKLSISPVKNNAGEISSFISSKEDISKQVNLEEVEKSYKEQMLKFGEQIPGFIYQYELFPDGTSRFRMATKGIYEIYECIPEDVIEDASIVFDRLHPDDIEEVKESIAISAEKLTLWEEEYRVILPKQGEKYLSGIAKPEREESGSIVWHGYIYDITERKKLEELMLKNEKRYNLAIETTDAGVWDWDIENNIVILSQRWKNMLGYEENEIEDSYDSWRRLWHPDDSLMISQAVKNHLEGKSHRYEIVYRILHKDGIYRWMMTRGDIIRDSKGKPIRFIGTNIDINKFKDIETELLIAQKTAEEASYSKSRFISNISHEIRTPINSIIGNANILKLDSEVKEIYKDRANSILISSEHLLSLVDEMLDMSKIESGKVELKLELFDINKVVDDVMIILSNQAETKKIKFTIRKNHKTEVYVIGDMLKIRQILLNLGSNAIKFTSKGSVEIDVVLNKRESGLMDFIFKVKDTGIGITEKDKPLVFDPFYHKSYNEMVGGTGLGLPIAKKYAELMGGGITFTSTYGIGSTFIFSVLLKPNDYSKHLINEETIVIMDFQSRYKDLGDIAVEDKARLLLLRESVIKGDVDEIYNGLVYFKDNDIELFNKLKLLIDEFDYQKVLYLTDDLLEKGEV